MDMFERVSVFGYGELNRVDLSNEVPKIVRKKRGNRDMNLYMSRIVNWGCRLIWRGIELEGGL